MRALTRRASKLTSSLALVVAAVGHSAWAAPSATRTEIDDLDPPPAEVVTSQVKVELPIVPDFAVPPPGPDGARTVRGVRLARDGLLGREVVVTGVVTWIYDCVTDVKKPGESDAATKARITDDPTLCERAKFHLSDAGTDRDDRSLWVVGMPRAYNAIELQRLRKADRADPERCEPSDPHSACHPYKVGDVVTVTGTFALSSPHSERNSDGLLVYKAMKDATAKWETPNAVWPPPVAITARPALATYAFAKRMSQPTRVAIAPELEAESLKHMAIGSRALGVQQYEDAIGHYRSAVELWPGNHAAWYYLGGALAAKGDWPRALEAFNQTVALRPDVAMYQLWLGVVQYEAAYNAAR